jgi:Mg2+/Co2+ transporter CorB
MEDIPASGTSLKLYGYPVEIMQTQHNTIKTIKLGKPLAVDD